MTPAARWCPGAVAAMRGVPLLSYGSELTLEATAWRGSAA